MSIGAIADGYLSALAEWEPAAAHLVGRSAPPLPDLSPDAVRSRVALDRTTAARLRAVEPNDEPESRLRSAMVERLEADVSLVDVGFTQSLVAPLATPLHRIRTLVESAVTDAIEAPGDLIRLLEGVPAALVQHRATLEWARRRGHVKARRQVALMAEQVRSWIGSGMAAVIANAGVARVPERFEAARRRAVAGACDAFLETAVYLEEVLAPDAAADDAVGDEVYSVTSVAFLGRAVDIDEVAAWGQDQVVELLARAEELAADIDPSCGLDGVCDLLDGRHQIAREEVAAWLDVRMSQAMRRLEEGGWLLPRESTGVRCVVTPASSGVMYYTPRPPDGTAPATVWWTVGGAHVPTWRQATTLHHEGVPGHHLQHAAADDGDLHPWQRHLCHVHGYAEGWAHHAEDVADEMGLIESSAERLGLVLGKVHRAARIVADTALHLDPGPGRTAGWTHNQAVEYLQRVARLDPVTARFEVDRYLGWPGQALAFRVGARQWERLRADAERIAGNGFHPPTFYSAMLALGPMGLGPLADRAGA